MVLSFLKRKAESTLITVKEVFFPPRPKRYYLINVQNEYNHLVPANATFLTMKLTLVDIIIEVTYGTKVATSKMQATVIATISYLEVNRRIINTNTQTLNGA